MTMATALAVVAGAGVFGANLQPSGIRIEGPPALADVAARVRAIDGERVARSLSSVGLAAPTSIHIRLVDQADPIAQHSPPWVVGRAVGTETIIIFPHRIGAYPYDSLEAVVIHEIAHLALSERAGNAPLPRWFHEGVAVAAESGWGWRSEARLVVAAQRGPAIEAVSALFLSDAQPSTTTAYLLSTALVADIRRRHGATVPGSIAARVANGEAFETAFVAETGETPNQAAAIAWRTYRGWRWLSLITSVSGIWGGILALAMLAYVVRLRRRRQKRRQWEAEETDLVEPLG